MIAISLKRLLKREKWSCSLRALISRLHEKVVGLEARLGWITEEEAEQLRKVGSAEKYALQANNGY